MDDLSLHHLILHVNNCIYINYYTLEPKTKGEKSIV